MSSRKQRQRGDEGHVPKAHEQPDDPVEAAAVGKQAGHKAIQEGMLVRG